MKKWASCHKLTQEKFHALKIGTVVVVVAVAVAAWDMWVGQPGH
jgi:hypothetical protein